MGWSCGIVGLPNVGKSTLFNALTATQAAEAANYPFCTIEPNIGRVAVPDRRLEICAGLAGSAKIVPTQLEFVDIAGLARGAAQGQGLGNQFLAHIREVEAILHVVRCFEDENVAHVEGSVDPIRDAEIVETELLLADLESLERRAPLLDKRARGRDDEAKAEAELVGSVLAALREGVPAHRVPLDPERRKALPLFQLLTAKSVLYVANVEEKSAASGNRWSEALSRFALSHGAACVIISAEIEAQLALLDDDERAQYLATLGLEETGLSRVIRAGYRLLDLITFFTVGPKEAHAWTIARGTKAREAAGKVHSDFERGFIRAEAIAYDDFVAHGGEQGAREKGRMRLEGADYVVEDGDILHFRFNV